MHSENIRTIRNGLIAAALILAVSYIIVAALNRESGAVRAARDLTPDQFRIYLANHYIEEAEDMRFRAWRSYGDGERKDYLEEAGKIESYVHKILDGVEVPAELQQRLSDMDGLEPNPWEKNR